MNCPFCSDQLSLLAENAYAIAFADGFPVSEGHVLVAPRRCVSSLFELSGDERAMVFELVAEVRELLSDRYSPAGFNVGLNDGDAAGQTVMHAHVHMIPRYKGDCDDPRGGVRWVLPGKADYWGD